MIRRKGKNRFEILPSTIPDAGRGLFARRRIPKGSTLRVSGFLVQRNSLEDLCTHYADPYKFRVGKDLLIPTGYAAMMNHSPRPNMAKVVAGRKVFLRVLREIRAGEELYLAYGPDALRRFRNRKAVH